MLQFSFARSHLQNMDQNRDFNAQLKKLVQVTPSRISYNRAIIRVISVYAADILKSTFKHICTVGPYAAKSFFRGMYKASFSHSKVAKSNTRLQKMKPVVVLNHKKLVPKKRQ